MLTHGLNKKTVFRFTKMITQFNQNLLFSPFFVEKQHYKQNPCFVSVKFQTFHGTGLSCIPKASLSESTTQSLNSTPFFAGRVNRVAKNEVQSLLCDYLHSTRGLRFADAEHISKNSPHFVEQLLSNIDSEKDVRSSLSRYLRYNPINEFEPFFESLGLKQSELPGVLPGHLIFLSDENVMLENFQILCDYGIPRSKIGKMFKEARDIFGCEYGVLDTKLRAYENLGLARATVIKLVSCCPTLLIGDLNKDFVCLLEKLKGLGLKRDWIGVYITTQSTCCWKRMEETIAFLGSVGYNDEHLRNLLETNPALLFQGSGKKVYVLFGKLIKLGLKINEVCSLFIQNPQLLSSKSLKNFLHGIHFLIGIGMDLEFVAKMVSTHTVLMGSHYLKGPKTVCREMEIKKDGLRDIIKEEPLKLFTLASKSKAELNELMPSRDPGTHFEKIAFLLRLGYVDNSEEMTKALKQFRGRGDQLQERFDCLVKAGLDSYTAASIVKQVPIMLNQNKDLIEKKIDFLTNFLGYPIESIVGFPSYLCYDSERIILRFKMYAWLRERDAAKPMLSLSTLLACSEKRFAKYFVNIHPEGPAMWESLKKSSASSLD